MFDNSAIFNAEQIDLTEVVIFEAGAVKGGNEIAFCDRKKAFLITERTVFRCEEFNEMLQSVSNIRIMLQVFVRIDEICHAIQITVDQDRIDEIGDEFLVLSGFLKVRHLGRAVELRPTGRVGGLDGRDHVPVFDDLAVFIAVEEIGRQPFCTPLFKFW